jgi:hypothetical protein
MSTRCTIRYERDEATGTNATRPPVSRSTFTRTCWHPLRYMVSDDSPVAQLIRCHLDDHALVLLSRGIVSQKSGHQKPSSAEVPSPRARPHSA